MVPASNPRLIMAVMIDEPSVENDEYFGGTVAAPVFSAVMTDTLRLLAIPQDAPYNNVVITVGAPDSVDEVRKSL
jgi:cell division protein FtsI (penicillin-binding protein 3)